MSALTRLRDSALRSQIRQLYRLLGGICVVCHREIVRHNDRQLEACAHAAQWPAPEVYARIAPVRHVEPAVEPKVAKRTRRAA